MSKKAIFVCLDDAYCKAITKMLSSRLEMPLFDCKEETTNNIVKSGIIFTDFSPEDFEKIEMETIKEGCKFNILKLSYDEFRLFKEKGFHTFYLKLPKKDLSQNEKLNILNYGVRNKFLVQNCEYVVDIEERDISNTISKIIEILGEKQ